MIESLPPEAFLSQVFRKRDTPREEYIRFASVSEFWHRFIDTQWTAHPYRLRSGGFELDWGNGDVFLCVFLASSSQFLELNPRQMYYWELCHDFHDYSDEGSSSGGL